LDIFPLCEDAGEAATSMYSPWEFEGVKSDGLGISCGMPFDFAVKRESDTGCDNFLSLEDSGVNTGV